MTKDEKKILGAVTLIFGDVTSHLIAIDKELAKTNPLIEQIEAHWCRVFEGRNLMGKMLSQMSPDIEEGIKELQQDNKIL